MDHLHGSGDGHHHFPGTHYVISEDVDILVSRWCSRVNLLSPAADFYVGLRSKMKRSLEEIFARVTFVSSQEIRQGLLVSIAAHRQLGLKVVSLERAYLEDGEVDGRIELTRTVDNTGEDVVIPSVRDGTPRKDIQYGIFSEKRIALIDDVVFSGKTLIGVISSLHRHHVTVHAITTAIGVKDGVDRLKKAAFATIGQPQNMVIDCLEEFDGVSDQVCERDFYPGIPYSGRQHMTGMGAFPYVIPFGRPNKWASIPDKEARAFSALCIDNTMALFGEIERLNAIEIPCSMIPRPVYGSPRDGTRFVEFLKRKRAECMNP
jgi:pyrimidine operon attenuation protein/uracil phosphoribosyltransferase